MGRELSWQSCVCVFMLAGVEAQGQTQQQGMACCGDLILGCHVHFNLPQAVKPADSTAGEAHHHCCMVGTLKMKLSDICRSYQEDPAKTKAAEKDHWVSMRCVAVCARFFFLIGKYGFAGAVHGEGSRASIVLSYASFRLNSGRHPC